MITLASDFGSPYPAAMKGVLARKTDAQLVDVAHDFPRQDPRTAAFWLRFVLPEFPPAVHLAVVDPGVGTDRAALVVRAGDHALVGPDNGLLIPAARALADGDGDDDDAGDDSDDPFDVFAVAVADPDSATFHGRDVFAPAAADVHEAGVDAVESIDRLAPVEEYVDLTLPEADVRDGGDEVHATVLAVDDFGNVVTNVPGGVLDGHETVLVAPGEGVAAERVPVVETFAAVDAGDALATVGSHGYVELDVNQGRGDDAFGLAVGDDVRLSLS